MKKYLILISLALISLFSYGQFGKGAMFPVAAGDTITNTGTANKIITCTAGYDAMGIQPVITKGTGTIGGNCIVYGSIDGTNYVSTGDTLKCTDITTNTKLFKYATTPYVYYKVVYTGTGTMVARWKVWYTLRKTITN